MIEIAVYHTKPCDREYLAPAPAWCGSRGVPFEIPSQPPAPHDSHYEGIVVMVTNPVDVLTYLFQKASGLPAERITAPAPCSIRRACVRSLDASSASIRDRYTREWWASTAIRKSCCGPVRLSAALRLSDGPPGVASARSASHRRSVAQPTKSQCCTIAARHGGPGRRRRGDRARA